jgi:hypothetical protein
LNRKELAAVVDTMVSAWQVEVADRKSLYRTWFRYLSDVGFDDALAAIDARVVAGDRWAPRVGEIRRTALDRSKAPVDWPDAETAWQRAETRLQDAASGLVEERSTFAIEVEEAIGRAMRRAGTRDGYHKHAFTKAWDLETVAFEQSRYGLPVNPPSVITEEP